MAKNRAYFLCHLCRRQFATHRGLAVHIGRAHRHAARQLRRSAAILCRAARLCPEAAGDRQAIRASHKEVFICSLPLQSPGAVAGVGDTWVSGRVFSVGPWLAAERIINGTHRLATFPEILQWKREGEERRRETEHAERMRVLRHELPVTFPAGPVTISALSAADALRALCVVKSDTPAQKPSSWTKLLGWLRKYLGRKP